MPYIYRTVKAGMVKKPPTGQGGRKCEGSPRNMDKPGFDLANVEIRPRKSLGKGVFHHVKGGGRK